MTPEQLQLLQEIKERLDELSIATGIPDDVESAFRFRLGLTGNVGLNTLLALTGVLYGDGNGGFTATSPLSGTHAYYVSDSSGGAVTRKLTFTDGVLTSQV